MAQGKKAHPERCMTLKTFSFLSLFLFLSSNMKLFSVIACARGQVAVSRGGPSNKRMQHTHINQWRIQQLRRAISELVSSFVKKQFLVDFENLS